MSNYNEIPTHARLRKGKRIFLVSVYDPCPDFLLLFDLKKGEQFITSRTAFREKYVAC